MATMSLPPGTPLPKFDNTLGSLLVGGLMAMALWGVTCVQTYNYFMKPNRDPIYMKTTVALLWLLDTFDSALNGHILYYYMVSNYLNPVAIFHPVWSVIIHVAVTAISNFIIRTLFSLRVYRLSQSNVLLTAWIMAISLSDLVVGITITVKAFKIATFPELSRIADLMYLTFGVGTGSDLSLALALSWLLYGSRTGFKRTDSVIKVLMMYTVNTGMIVAIDASLGLILYVVMPNNFIFLGFYLLLSKLYVNAYLATLNARDTLRLNDTDLVTINLSTINARTHSSRFDLESTPAPEEEKAPHKSGTENGRMAISIQTVIDKETIPQNPPSGSTMVQSYEHLPTTVASL